MCEECKQTVLQVQELIDAIDKNREALNVVFDQIHADMHGKLVVHNLPDGSQPPIDFKSNYLGRVMMAQYVAAFLAGECPTEPQVEATIGNFYNTGFKHGNAYAGARQAQLN